MSEQNKIKKEKSRKNHRKPALPKLHPLLRILLYLVMAACISWTLYIVRSPSPLPAVNYTAYLAGSVMLVLGLLYLIPDLKHLGKRIAAVLRRIPFLDSLLDDPVKMAMFFTGFGLLFNIAYAGMNLYASLQAGSQWSFSFAVYYAVLSVMRLAVILAWYLSKGKEEGDRLRLEQKVYYRISQLLAFMSLAIGGITVLILFSREESKSYPGTLIYAVALYTFVRVILAVRNLILAPRMNSLLLAILRKVGYVDACMALLSLQMAMIGAFGNEGGNFAGMMNLMTGGIICLMTFLLSLQGVHRVRRLQEKKTK